VGPPLRPDAVLTRLPPLATRRYEEIRVTFPAARAKQLTALEAYRVRLPSARARAETPFESRRARLRIANERFFIFHSDND